MPTVSVPHNTEQHHMLLETIKDLIDYSERETSDRRDQWDKDEERFYFYIDKPEDEEEADDDKGRPEYKTLTVPVSYAIAMTMHTYLSTVFLSRNPIFMYQGRHGESQDAQLTVESLIEYQINSGGARPPLYNWLMDHLRYGIGIVGTFWDIERQNVSRLVEVPEEIRGPLFGNTKLQKVTESVRGFVGNRIYNVRPHDFGWDPRYSLMSFQEGQFCWELTKVPWTRVKAGVANGLYIEENIEHLEKKRLAAKQRKSGNMSLPEEIVKEDPQASFNPKDTEALEIHDFYWEIIPSEWGLGSSNQPEKWVFGVAEKDTIIYARPLGLFHNQFPFSVLPLEIDAYRTVSRSMMDITGDMEDTVTWLINQHFYNVRKHLNNTIVADPSRVVMKDLYQRNPGGVVRLKARGMQQDIRQLVHQIPSTDITRSHMEDARSMQEFMQALTGATDNVMGMLDPGGRKTATEIRTSTSFATNRLKTLAEWGSATGFGPLGMQLLQNTQQFLDQEMTVRLAGDMLRGSNAGAIKASPETIAGFYDFVPVDGTMPVDKLAIAQVMKDLVLQMRNFPQVMQQFDVPELFNYVAELSGVKNLNRFRLEVSPDQDIQEQVRQGNLAPITQASGRAGSAAGGQSSQPRQTQGLGSVL